MAGGSIYVSSELGSLATDPLRRLPTTTEYVVGDGVWASAVCRIIGYEREPSGRARDS